MTLWKRSVEGRWAMASEFNFQELAFLARIDAEAFEHRRRRLIDDFLDASSEPQRSLGRRLQREIDARRQRTRNPADALADIFAILRQHTEFLADSLVGLRAGIRDFETSVAMPAPADAETTGSPH
jgi:hypothetical protein